MDRRTKWIGSAVLVLLLVIFLLIGLRAGWRSRGTWFSSRAGQTKATSKPIPQSKRATPEPSVSLQVNSAHELTVFAGTPLIFKVRLGNRFAQNAALHNEALRHRAEQVRTAAAGGEISQERAARLLAGIGQPSEFPIVRVGDSALSWEQFVHFYLQLPDGKMQPLPWTPNVAAFPPEKALTLDARNTSQVEYLLTPSTSQPAVGVYQVLATLEVPANAKTSDDNWRGRVQSDPVVLKIVPKPDHLTQAGEEEWNLQFVRYYRKAHDPAQALRWAQKTLQGNSKSILAHVLIGEIKEAQGDLEGALATYHVALAECYEQYPDSYEPPQYLIMKTSQLVTRLREAAPKVEQAPEH